MNKFARFACVSSLLVFVHPALAYKEPTHEDMSEVAALSSTLANSETLNILGLSGGLDDPNLVFPNSEGKDKTIKFLIRDGSKFEDSGLRSLFHFFDPVNDEGLLFFTSPTWTLEDKGRIHILQRYSFRDGRDVFYKALTATSENDRKQYFGKTFETLGHVVHHVQDMAQPQHVRNDVHLDLSDYFKEEVEHIENRSRYEFYTLGKGGNLPFTNIAYNASSPVRFDTARKFWHTEQKNPIAGQGMAEFTNTNFLSAGTNFDTNLYTYPRRADAVAHDENANDLLRSVGADIPTQCVPPNPPCQMTFYTTRVTDNFRSSGSNDNPRTSTESIFDQDLKAKNLAPVFSLNRFNFDAAHEFLIPRAVAYSAGLIDYFFRGRLEAEGAELTDTGIRLRVKNTIDPQATPAWASEALSGGMLVVAYEYKDGSGTKHYGASVPIALTEMIEPRKISQAAYNFTFSEPVPDGAREVKYRLVFRGKLGQEDDAIAVGPVRPVSGFLVTPNYTPADGISGARMVYRRDGRWTLDSALDLQAGNIDWKGWYVNGKPTKVLSWDGPRARYFKVSGDPEYTPDVYQNGERWAVAPRPVLGAALYKDTELNEWIVVICNDGSTDYVYRRPNKKSDSTGLHDVLTNPEGWLLLDSFPAANGRLSPEMPWFFNGSGTEAQTLRPARRAETGIRSQIVYDGGNYTPVPVADAQTTYLDRLKINISGSSAQPSEVTNAPAMRASNVDYSGEYTCLSNCDTDSLQVTCGSVGPSATEIANTPKQHTTYAVKSVFTTTDSGNYVVAVDYDDAGEVLAEVSLQANQQDSMTYNDEQIWAICGNPTGGNRAYVKMPGSFSIARRIFSSSVKKVLKTRGQELALEDHAFDIDRTFEEYLYSSPPTVSRQSFSAPTFILSALQYLDLRTGTVLYTREKRSYYLTDEFAGFQDQKKVRFDRTNSVLLAHGTDVNEIYKSEDKGLHAHWAMDYLVFPPVSETKNTSHYLTVDFISNYEVPIVPFPALINDLYLSYSSSPNAYYPLHVGNFSLGAPFSTKEYKGSIGVDSDKSIFASVPYKDKTGADRRFNYLTDRDVGQVIPIAPPEASYGVRVLK